jgi:hypothetical protein
MSFLQFDSFCTYIFMWLCGSFSERRHKKKVDDGKTDSTGSLNSSDNEDRKKDDRHSSGNEKDDTEAQVWTLQSVTGI